MTVQAWRLCDAAYGATMWTGEGALRYGGRWNGQGVAVVYCSANRSLAALEQLVHLIPSRSLTGHVLASITLDSTQIETVDVAKLPLGWDDPVAGPATHPGGGRRCRRTAPGQPLPLVVRQPSFG